jgi:transcriptional regulator with XRE-family HTH domain
MNTKISIGKRIKELREKSGLNQEQIALFLGLDQTTVSKCERDERQFSVDSLEKLCDLFGCTMEEFFAADVPVESLSFAFRATSIEIEDLNAISEINRIVLNFKQMKQLLEAE